MVDTLLHSVKPVLVVPFTFRLRYLQNIVFEHINRFFRHQKSRTTCLFLGVGNKKSLMPNQEWINDERFDVVNCLIWFDRYARARMVKVKDDPRSLIGFPYFIEDKWIQHQKIFSQINVIPIFVSMPRHVTWRSCIIRLCTALMLSGTTTNFVQISLNSPVSERRPCLNSLNQWNSCVEWRVGVPPSEWRHNFREKILCGHWQPFR